MTHVHTLSEGSQTKTGRLYLFFFSWGWWGRCVCGGGACGGGEGEGVVRRVPDFKTGRSEFLAAGKAFKAIGLRLKKDRTPDRTGHQILRPRSPSLIQSALTKTWLEMKPRKEVIYHERRQMKQSPRSSFRKNKTCFVQPMQKTNRKTEN